MFKIYDISMTIDAEITVWKNKDEKRPQFINTSNFEKGSTYETRISIDAHTGTHIDAPLHMIEGGATIESYKLEDLAGSAKVLDLTSVSEGIGRADLEQSSIAKGDWVILKTRNSLREDWDMEFVYLKEDGAQYLLELGVKGVGIDALGIERAQPDYPTHKTLLGNGIIILEGLRLKEVEAGSYMLIVAPLKLSGIEAAPARAILLGSPF